MITETGSVLNQTSSNRGVYRLDFTQQVAFRHQRRSTALYLDAHVEMGDQRWLRLGSANNLPFNRDLKNAPWTRGTATALSGQGYTAAGKTGSAEYDEYGSSHSWFVGYSNVDDPDIVVAIIVEGGGTGSEAAVPIASEIFNTYYYG